MKTFFLAAIISFAYCSQAAAVHPSKAVVADQAVGAPAETRKIRIQETYARLPLYFIRNQGQLDERVRFYEKEGGHATLFTEDGLYIALTRNRVSSGFQIRQTGDEHSTAPPQIRHTESLRLLFVGADRGAELVAEELLEGRVNYFIGNDPSKWKRNIPTYGAVRYKGLYKGIDARFYGSNRQLEYDLIVQPGADPSTVRFAYEGAESLKITEAGDLEIGLGEGLLLQKQPSVYQEKDGKRVAVEAAFVITETNRAQAQGHLEEARTKPRFTSSFKVAAYDRARPLVIDPVLIFSTYLGGSASEFTRGVATDDAGNVYVVGETYSDDFPVVSSLQPFRGPGWSTVYGDLFITKLNPAGSSLIYSTYLGGEDHDFAGGIAVDSTGNAYVTGHTLSVSFPLQSAFQVVNLGGLDAFITKLNAAGSALAYSSYLGGTGADIAEGITVDTAGNAYITGLTTSTNFPVASAVQPQNGGVAYVWDDAFVTKVSPAPALLFSTYLGGSGIDHAHGIAIGPDGDVHVVGQSDSSTDLPGLPPGAIFGGAEDAFFSRLSGDGSVLRYSLFMGGSGQERGDGIAIDRLGRVYITGVTGSDDLPLWWPGFPGYCVVGVSCPLQMDRAGGLDAFVAAFEADGQNGIYSTYLGGSSDDEPLALAVDGEGNTWVVGETDSTDFPTYRAIQASAQGLGDGFVSKVDGSGALLHFSSYLGTGSKDVMSAIAMDADHNAVVGGWAGSGFPTAPGTPCVVGLDCPFQFNNAGGFDAVVLRVRDDPLNDNCGAATVVATGQYSGTLLGATNDGSASFTDAQNQPDVWYRYTAPSGGTLRVDTCGTHDQYGVDTGMDTVLSLHTACPGTSSNQSAANDDWVGGSDPTACTGTDSGFNRDSAVISTVSAGQSVVIRVSKYYSSFPGNFRLNLALEISDPPVIDGTAVDGCISELCRSTLSVTAHDPQGGTLSYTWTPLNGGVIVGSGASVLFDPPDTGPHPCPYRVKVTVTSSASGLSTSQTIDITVKLAGDVDGNGVVNVLDKLQVRNHFGDSGAPGWIDADVNCDGFVNVLDKVKVRNQFGQRGCGCP